MCTLRPVPPKFEAKAGKTVTLVVKDKDIQKFGKVAFETATYDGKELVPADKAVTSIQFEIVKGLKPLEIVFTFTKSKEGKGELWEDCGGGESQLIRDLEGDEPYQLLNITGK